MLLKVFVFTSLSLQFNFRVHTCILIKQYLLLIFFFSKYQSLSLPVLEAKCAWNLHFLISSFAHFLICCHFSNFFQFPKKVRVIDRKSNVILHPVLIACLDCLSWLLFHFGLYTILGLLSFCLISRTFFILNLFTCQTVC